MMSKITLAFGSFAAGAFCTLFILSGIHASTWAQSGPVEGISTAGGMPIVPPIHLVVTNADIGPTQVQTLDGLSCVNCKFSPATVVYGGGAFLFKNTTFGPGHPQLELVGAAANTALVLRIFGFLGNPSASKSPPPTFEPPKLQTIDIASPIMLTIATEPTE